MATIPAGPYTLRLASGTDYCCYSRWTPAATPGLRLYDVTVTTTGDDQVILITEIPELGHCGIDDEPAISEACLSDMQDAAGSCVTRAMPGPGSRAAPPRTWRSLWS